MNRVALKIIGLLLILLVLLVGCGISSPVQVSEATPSMPLPSQQTLISLTPTTSPTHVSTAVSTAQCVVQAPTGLNLRTGPSTSTTTLRTLGNGSELIALGRTEQGDWILVQTNDRNEGWISASYIICQPPISSLAVTSSPAGTDSATGSGPRDVPTGVLETQLPFYPATPPAAVPTDIVETPLPSLTTSPTMVVTESPLRRRDAPPEGVAAQLRVYTGGAGHAPPGPTGEPRVEFFPYNGIQEIATDFLIEFGGFPLDQALDVQVVQPDGRVRQQQIDLDGDDAFWYWESLPGDPYGEYLVTATQEELQATGVFTISAASTPRLYPLLPHGAGRPGTAFQFALAGFQPGQSVPLHLYYWIDDCSDTSHRGSDYCWRYATRLPAVQVDSRGEAFYTLVTQPDDPEGKYALETEPPAISFRWDEISSEYYRAGGGFSIQR